MSRILVTGAGGTVGSEVVKALAALGAPLRAAFHSEAKAAAARRQEIDAVAVDYSNGESLREALRGVSALFLLGPVSDRLAELEAGVVQAATAAGVRHLVKLSVWRASEEGYSFARWHRASEKNVEASGLPYTFLRPNGFMQNFVTYHGASIRSHNAFYLAAGHARTSPIDVRDIAAVAASILTSPGHAGRAYDLSGPEALNYHQVANALSVATGRKIAYVNVTEEEYRKAVAAQGSPDWLCEALIDMQRYENQGLASDVLGSVQQILGRRATSFDRFARDHARAWS